MKYILVILPALLWKKNYILTALNDLSLRLICFQQVSLICDLTTKLWRKRISSQKQKIKCAKVPKVISNLHVSIFCDISLRLTNCSIFLQKCLPTYIFLHFVCPNANQFEGPNTYKKESKLCVQIWNYPPMAPNFKTELPISFEQKIEDSLSKIKEKLELKCPSVLIR